MTEGKCNGLKSYSLFGPSVLGFSSSSANWFIYSLILLKVCLESSSSDKLILDKDSTLIVEVMLPWEDPWDVTKFSVITSKGVGISVQFCSKNQVKGFRLVDLSDSGCLAVEVLCTDGIGKVFLFVWVFI